MKIKTDFITNSSSASFIINLRYISAWQLEQICNHEQVAGDDAWTIELDEEYVRGRTWMDNFDMEEYLQSIRVDMSRVTFGDYFEN